MVTLTVMHQLLNFFCVLVISEKAVLVVLLVVMQLHHLTVQRLVLANERRREKNFQFLQKLKSPRTNLYCNGQLLLQIHRLMGKYKHEKQGRCHIPVIASRK